MSFSALAGFSRAIQSRFFGKPNATPAAIVESLENRTLLTGYVEHLAFFTQPANIKAGAILIPPVVIDLENDTNGIVMTDQSQVTLTLSSGVLGGTTTVTAINGVAAFNNLTIAAPGAYTIVASASEEKPITSKTFVVTPALHLAFVQQPIDSAAGGPIAPVIVAVEDPDGNVATTDKSIVTVASVAGPLVASAKVVDGQATFNNLSLAAPGDYTLKATDGSDAPAMSNSFSVNPISPAALALAPVAVKSMLPTEIVVGSTIRGGIAVGVTNDTQAAVQGAVTVNVFASSDGAVDESAVQVATLVRQINLGAGKTAVVHLAVKSSSAALPIGAYSLLAQTIGPSGQVSDAPFGPWLRVEAPAVQLQDAVGSLAAAKIRPGGGGGVSVLVTNEGNSPFDGLATFDIGLSSDGLTELASLDTLRRHLRLKAGKGLVLNVRLALGSFQTPGVYFPFVSITESGVTVPAVGPMSFTIVG
ncbi:MAG TPA: hypothetical protein VG326_02220 [Tepidisphaeraceae bacterium]|jgi:hypothetical protein|nr:hypothetical protein [Tepidisphaeraceae bacterium]